MTKQDSGPWRVTFSTKAKKQQAKLPEHIKIALGLLMRELKEEGPERRNWPHYGPIKGQGKGVDTRHCHLNKSRPTYMTKPQ
ncbi:MAG: cytotoxic translational repressor of toxin-antitoxin stability system [Deltaproteobacteria bacterium]|jgi:hypothetical protein|nr:cytotoxic translational repressor of toxin-antitoxin stability system [Deltaproteobacteria bacterium]